MEEEEEIGVCRKVHSKSPYCHDIKRRSSSNFFKCETNVYLHESKAFISKVKVRQKGTSK